MTLIVSQASREFVLQISDRLVTQAGKSFDPISNKNILYFAPDAIVSIGYTGLAYLDGIPTDQWLTEVLTGRNFERNERKASVIFGNSPRWLHIGPALDLLEKQLSVVFTQKKMRTQDREFMFELLIVGWQWGKRKRKKERPIVAGILKEYGLSSNFKVWREDRHFGNDMVLSVTPECNIKQDDVKTVFNQLAKINNINLVDDAERTLVDMIRSVSKKNNLVGADCMSILLPHPKMRCARIRFIPVMKATLAVTPRFKDSDPLIVPAAFSPWIISKNLIHIPSVLAGNTTFSVGGFCVKLEAPTPRGRGLKGAMGSITRPPEPK